MGIEKKAEAWGAWDELAGDAPVDVLDAINSHVRSAPVFLRMYAYHIAMAITAFVAAAIFREYRIALIGAGLCIRPVATWVAFSDANETVKGVVARTSKILRGVFVAYCIYLAATSLRG
jgi:hypothetical protein